SDRIRKISILRTAAGRRRSGAFIVEGPQSVREAVEHTPGFVRDLYLTVEASQRHPEILDAATASGLYLHLCSPDVIAAMSPDAQGVVAVLTSPDRHRTDFTASGRRGGRFFAGLIEARDPGNTGALVGADEPAGSGGLVLRAGGVEIENPRVVRPSAGPVLPLPSTTGARTPDHLGAAKAAGIQVLATTAQGAHRLDELGA